MGRTPRSTGAGDVLGRRALNRATLERQLLLRRWDLPVTGRSSGYLAWRPLLQPVLDRSQRGGFGRATAGVDLAELAAAARRLLADRPLTRPELGTSPQDLIRRHLAAFGPASVNDIQAWCGLTRLREPVQRLGGELRRFRDEHGRQLYDLPDAPRPDPDTPAPPRLLPTVDNLLLAHHDRTRVMSDQHRSRVCVGAVVQPTVLVDGVVVATWKLVRERGGAVLEIELLTRLSGTDQTTVAQEGMRLLDFAAADADDHDIRLVAPGS